jgi:hypothetical protein
LLLLSLSLSLSLSLPWLLSLWLHWLRQERPGGRGESARSGGDGHPADNDAGRPSERP